MDAAHDELKLLPDLRWKSWWVILAGVLLVAALGGLAAFVIFQPIKVLPRIRLAPGFALTETNGERLTNEDLRGHFVVYNFTHTDCHAPDCVQYDQIMRQVQDRLGEANTDGVPIDLVTIAFDADRATPEKLNAYASSLGAQPDVWRFVSGDAKNLKNVIGGGFQVYYAQTESGDYEFSPAMVLVDGWGIVRAIYNTRSTPPNADNILRHFGVLAEEVRNSKGVARVGYEAAHLFLCYAS
ncbi:MAG: SCO family protein [Caldilineales bacterium]|nr:SCO family protein [Caldilineales bacterium]